MKTHAERANFLWGIAELLRDHFKRGKYQDVILPLTVLRRVDRVLEPTKEAVLKRNAELKDLGLENRDAQLRKVSGYAFYNTSRYDFRRLLADASASYRAMADWGEVEGPEDWQETVRKADESLDNGSFLIERLGADRHLDPTLMAVLLAMRRRLIDEHGATTAAELMLVDSAVLSYYHLLRVNGWIGNLGQWLEAEFFQLAAPSAGLVGLFGSDNRKPFQGEEVTQRIAERLMPLLDRANRMLIRNLKALRERRHGLTPSVSIGAAGQVNVGGVQQVNGTADPLDVDA